MGGLQGAAFQPLCVETREGAIKPQATQLQALAAGQFLLIPRSLAKTLFFKGLHFCMSSATWSSVRNVWVGAGGCHRLDLSQLFSRVVWTFLELRVSSVWVRWSLLVGGGLNVSHLFGSVRVACDGLRAPQRLCHAAGGGVALGRTLGGTGEQSRMEMDTMAQPPRTTASPLTCGARPRRSLSWPRAPSCFRPPDPFSLTLSQLLGL